MSVALVTGGCGFVGSHLVRALLADGHTVRVVDDLSTGRRINAAGAEFHKGSVCEEDLLYHVMRGGVDTVYHLAAIASVPLSLEAPMEVHHANVTGTLAVLEAARSAGVRRVVFASSAGVYGDAGVPPEPLHEGIRHAPINPYAASKAAAEAYVLAYSRAGLLPGVALRFGNVYGPGQRADSPYCGVVARFCEAARTGQPARIYGDGEATRDFIYVGDVVQALMRAATADVAGRAINVGTGAGTTVRTLLGYVWQAHGLDWLPSVADPDRAGDIRYSVLDVAAMRHLLGVEPMGLADGLKLTAKG